jgi:hypothetical protein
MANTSETRRRIRAEALAEVRKAIGDVRAPAGKPQGWVTEFNRGLAAASRLLENQIAQAEGRVVRREKRRRGAGRAGGERKSEGPQS